MSGISGLEIFAYTIFDTSDKTFLIEDQPQGFLISSTKQ